MTLAERDNQILDMWAGGFPAEMIANKFNLSNTRISDIACNARAKGDPRAAKRQRGRPIRYIAKGKEMIRANMRGRSMKSLAKRFPATGEDLALAIANSSVPITKLPPGWHYGWKPRWL